MIHVYLEKYQPNMHKYLNLLIDKTGAGPHKSQCIFLRIEELEC